MSASLPPLRELQELMWKLITAPEGVAAGLDALHRRGAPGSPRLDSLVHGDARLDAVGRLDVYADMYFYRLRDCLAEDYPKALACIGPERFHNLVTDYLLAHPSSHFSLRELGRALPGFLDGHALVGSFPELPDLTRLEWARVDVFDERDAEALDREALLARAGAEPDFRVTLAPAVRRLHIRAAALRRWREPEARALDGDPERVPVLVWRRSFGVYHRALDGDEAGCLDALAAAPRSLPELGEALVAAAGDESDPAAVGARLAALLATWTRDTLLCAEREPARG